MDQQSDTFQPTFAAAPAGRDVSSWWGWLLWLPACVAFAALLAWAAHIITPHFSPLIVFPILLGVLLGASITSLIRMFQMGHRPTAWVAVLVSTIVIIVGQHYLSYRAALGEADRTIEKIEKTQAAFAQLFHGELPNRPTGLLDYLNRQAREGRPMSTVFGSFTARGPLAWLCWSIDGLLVLIPAALMVGFALRRPFCRQCRSWYATRRTGRLDSNAVRRLATDLPLPIENPSAAGHYRLICCNQGCAPTGFSLSLEESSGPNHHETFWLDDSQRAKLVEILDAARQNVTN